MDRVILHCDMNNCYASIEAIINPELRGKPIAVCGSEEERRGIVLAKSQQAKECGVATGDTVWLARKKCKDIIIVPPHHDKYLTYSKLAQLIYYEYTDLIEPYGLDECWLDVTGSQKLYGNGEEIAHQIRKRIKSELGLTISVGVSFNKVFAKLGSDLKKPDAVSVISRDNYKEVAYVLPANEMLGVGKKTYQIIKKYGMITIGDVANSTKEQLIDILGKNGEHIWLYANGYENSSVELFQQSSELKSVGNGITCKEDLVNVDDVWEVILALSMQVSGRLREIGMYANGVQLTIKDSELSTKQYQKQTEISICSSIEVAKECRELFEENYRWRKNVRAVTVRAINISNEKQETQLSLLDTDDKHNVIEEIDATAYKIRQKFGDGIIKSASLIKPKNESAFKSDSVLPTPFRKK